jgi:gluconokinase
VVVVLMGVSGSGKTTVGRALADALGCAFLDGDDLHPPANVAKMAAGVPLDDADRAPWLAAVRAAIDRVVADGGDAVVACSALKQAYRDALGVPRAGVALVWLTADPATLAARLAARRHHFMPPALLPSQLATLEPPGDAIVVDVAAPPAAVVAAIRRALAR